MLSAFNRSALIFSVKSYLSAMIALYVALRMGLTNPFWAVISAYIVAQPKAGAVASKASFRLIGTLTGAVMAVFLVPPLAQSREPLALAIALWLGLCVFLATIDKTPRSYLFVMAGVTTCVIAFPSTSEPTAVFDIAVARVEEITLGILSATVVHAVLWPSLATKSLMDKVDQALTQTAQWTADALHASGSANLIVDRRKLAVAINEIHGLMTQVRYEGSLSPARRKLFNVLLTQLEILLPLSVSVDELINETRHEMLLSEDSVQLLKDICSWFVAKDSNQTLNAAQLQQRCADQEPSLSAGMNSSEMMQLCLFSRLSELIAAMQKCRELHHAVQDEAESWDRLLLKAYPKHAARSVERDYFSALVIAGSAGVTLFLACLLWIASGWTGGTNAVLMAGVFYVVYSGFDDPAHALKNKFIGVIVRMGLGIIYVAAVLPSIDGFPLLAAALAPVFILSGVLLTAPRYSPLAFNLIVGLSSPVILSDQFTADFVGYVNNGLATLSGIMFALVSMTIVQPIWLQTVGQRLMRAIWSDIAEHRYVYPEWRSKTTHRIALLANKAVRVDGVSLRQPSDALRDYGAGQLLAELTKRNGSHMPTPNSFLIANEISKFYRRLLAGDHRRPPESLRHDIDKALEATIRISDVTQKRTLVIKLASLRCNLFPSSRAANKASS
ncbi:MULTISPECIES: FUSC family protein [unclassified Paraburkholderia]|uniref:FUSC family protein n=1 Tax=unclassified Paraburkholderia TaxID=2615204 RepID=UPI002AAFCA9E|nr:MULTISPECIES: FUSC family protein [unclassified Paraburkholderia]